jgi:Zn-dependent protease with chaperone function
MARKILKGLSTTEYEHPADKKALDVLKKTPGVDLVGNAILKYGIEKINRIQYTGSSIKVTEDSFPELNALFIEACGILDLETVPDFYIYLDYSINAFSLGQVNPMVVFTSGTIDSLSQTEFMYVLGHELGHIKSGHCKYHMMASVLPILGEILGSVTLGIGNAVAQGLNLALLSWYRKSELTADRAGLLVVQQADAVIGAMMKISGVPKRYYGKALLESFIKQAKEFESYDTDNLNRIAKLYDTMNLDHPWTVMRASEIMKWIDSGVPEQIFNAH